MKTKYPAVLCTIAFCVALFSGGCFRMQKVTLKKRYFMLHVSRPENRPRPESAPALGLRRLKSAQQFQGQGFVYRRDDVTYESDFYNRFFIPAAALLTDTTSDWLNRSGLFSRVLEGSDAAAAPYRLDGRVTSLYGDYRDGGRFAAVLEIEFSMSHNPPDHRKTAFQKRYAETIPVRDETPEALVKSWNQGLYRILEALETDLAGELTKQ
jgi:uncharacterized lipoprotein YmbA